MTKEQKQKFKKYFLDYQKHYIRNKRLYNLSEKDEKFDQEKVTKARNNMQAFCYPTKWHFDRNHTRLQTMRELYAMWYMVKHDLYLDENLDKCREYMQQHQSDVFYMENDNDLYWIKTFKEYIDKLVKRF
jgi:hypothetical protein